MAWPQTALGVKFELLLAGTWTDITPYVWTDPDIEITRGRPAETATVDPGRCSFDINNSDARFSPRNPVGPYYGQIGRNTPIRVSVAEAIVDGPAFDAYSFRTPSTFTGDASWTHTPNSAPKGVLVFIVQNVGITDEVVGVTYGGVAMSEVSGSPLLHSTGAEDGALYGYFLGDGIPTGPQTVAIDVDATGSTKTAICYTVTADTTTVEVDDTTILDSGGTVDPTVTLTTTKKTRNFAALHSGHDSIGSVTPAAGHSRDGSGIDFGTQVADFIHASLLSNAGSPTIGWTATSEEAGVLGVALRNGGYYARFYGEVPAWPANANTLGTDVRVRIEAAGILRRLGQGASPLRSAPYRFAVINGAHEFWPLDEGAEADLGAPAIGTNPFRYRGFAGASQVHPSEGELAAWLPNGVRIHNNTIGSKIIAQVSLATVSTWAVDVAYAGENTGNFYFAVYSGDGLVIWKIRLDTATNQIEVRLRTGGENSTETLIDSAVVDEAFDGRLHVLRLATSQNGSNADYTVYLDGVSEVTGTTAATVDQDGIAELRLAGYVGSGDVNVSFGNVAVWNGTGVLASEYSDAVFGHSGETAGTRIGRLCLEEDIQFQLEGTASESSGLGPQYADTFLEIIQEAADTDGGILYEPRHFLGLAYRTRRNLYNQTATLAVAYDGEVFGPAPEPVDDDQFTRNDITVERRDGGIYNAVLNSGTLSVLAPPNGVGRYDMQETVNVIGDGKDLEDQATWRLHLGTVDEARFPQLVFDLVQNGFVAAPSLLLNTATLDVGDLLTVSSPPSWLSPNTISQLAIGFTELITEDAHGRVIVPNCVPASPWQITQYESSTGSTVNKWDTGGSTLASGITSGATSLSVATATGHPVWTDVDTEDGFDIHIGGERMTVTDISGTSSPQTFTVTRSVNGVVKTHSADAAVRLWQTPVYGL